MIKLVDLYKVIPVYPETMHCAARGFPTDAPLCEDDGGGICYLSEEQRKRWLDKVKREENNRLYRKRHGLPASPYKLGDMYTRVSSNGVQWYYLICEEEGTLVAQAYSKNRKGKVNYRHSLQLNKIPGDVVYEGLYADDPYFGSVT